MSFSNSNIAAMEAALKQAAGALLALNTVTPYGGTGDVLVKFHVSTKRANETDLTGGAASDSQLIATVDYDDWQTKIGREPQRGDVFHWLGRRYAVDRSIAAAPAGNGVFYKVRLEG